MNDPTNLNDASGCVLYGDRWQRLQEAREQGAAREARRDRLTHAAGTVAAVLVLLALVALLGAAVYAAWNSVL